MVGRACRQLPFRAVDLKSNHHEISLNAPIAKGIWQGD